MSMAARAVSSRAVSSISLVGIAAELAAMGPGPPRLRRSAPAAPLVAPELVLHGVDQRLPGRLDDVVGHAHRAPRLVAVPGGDEHAGARRGALALVQDAHLVVEQRHLAE